MRFKFGNCHIVFINILVISKDMLILLIHYIQPLKLPYKLYKKTELTLYFYSFELCLNCVGRYVTIIDIHLKKFIWFMPRLCDKNELCLSLRAQGECYVQQACALFVQFFALFVKLRGNCKYVGSLPSTIRYVVPAFALSTT